MAQERLFILLLLISFELFPQCLSQTVCSGFLLGTFDDVVVSGTGSQCGFVGVAQKVTVTDGANFLAFGKSEITEIRANGALNIGVVGNSTAQDIFSFGTIESVVVGPSARIDRLVMKDSGDLEHEGFIGTLTFNNSGNLRVSGVIGSPSSYAMYIENSRPSIELCNASIGNVYTKDSSPHFVAENSSSCPPTNISSLSSIGTDSSILVKGVTLTGRNSFTAYNVGEVDISHTTVLGRLNTRLISGSISLKSVLVQDSLSLVGLQSSTTILDSEFKEVVRVGAPDPSSPHVKEPSFSTTVSRCGFKQNLVIGPSSGNVTISESKFSKSKVYIETQTGGVKMTGNENFSLGLQQVRFGVEVSVNVISDGSFHSNTAGVKLVSNTFENLLCFGNYPPPILINNTVTKGGAGQCSSA